MKMLCFFSPKATEIQKYLFFFHLRSSHCSIFITNPSRSCQLRWWRLPQALKILKYLYIPYSFVKVNFGYFSFFTSKIRTSLWQFRLFSRKVIAYKLSNKIDTQLAVDTVNMAVANRGKSTGVIFHTDRGCQFTSSVFRRYLDNLNMIQSFSAKGHPYDNAIMECFFKYLKKEEVNRKSYSSFDELNVALFQYINGFYNSLRPHSHNNGLSPNQAETSFY